MDEPYHRVGRGGAGNFYSKKDISDAVSRGRAAKEDVDLEAQKPGGQLPNVAPASGARSSSTLVYTARSSSGRGGAGNLVHPSSLVLPRTTLAPASVQQTPNAAAAAAVRRPSHGGGALSGRGGAGNWAQTTLPAPTPEPERRRKALDAKVSDDVEAALAAPSRAYHMQGHHEGKGEVV
jgi:hypothetical protein